MTRTLEFELERDEISKSAYKVKRKGLIVGYLSLNSVEYPMILKEMVLK